MVLNAVCSDCNAGWLNQLEDQALPVLEYLALGRGVFPARAQLKAFAFWAVTRALLRTHYSSAGRAPRVLFEEVHRQRRTHLVPKGCIVSVAPTFPVNLEEGTHQSGRLGGDAYLGHVVVSWGYVLISVLLVDHDEQAIALAQRASDQRARWFPGSFWQLGPLIEDPGCGRALLQPEETRVAASALGFFLGLAPRDPSGIAINLNAVVPKNRRGPVPWPDFLRHS